MDLVAAMVEALVEMLAAVLDEKLAARSAEMLAAGLDATLAAGSVETLGTRLEMTMAEDLVNLMVMM